MSSKLDMVLQTMESKSKKFLLNISPDIIKRELEIVGVTCHRTSLVVCDQTQ